MMMLAIEYRTLYMLGQCFITELQTKVPFLSLNIFVCVRVYVCVCVCVCTGMCTVCIDSVCVWRPMVNIECLLQYPLP